MERAAVVVDGVYAVTAVSERKATRRRECRARKQARVLQAAAQQRWRRLLEHAAAAASLLFGGLPFFFLCHHHHHRRYQHHLYSLANMVWIPKSTAAATALLQNGGKITQTGATESQACSSNLATTMIPGILLIMLKATYRLCYGIPSNPYFATTTTMCCIVCTGHHI